MFGLLVLVCLVLSVQARSGAISAPAQLHHERSALRKPLYTVHDPRLRIYERGQSVGSELPSPAAALSPQGTDMDSTHRSPRSAPRYPPAHAAHGTRALYTPPPPQPPKPRRTRGRGTPPPPDAIRQAPIHGIIQ